MRRITVAFGVLTVLLLAAPAGAELCEKCKGKMYIANVGQCVECGGFTGSGAHKLCRKCSARLGQCEHCRAPLKGAKPAPVKPTPKPVKINWKKPGTYTSGKWKYEYQPHAKGPRSRGSYGRLFYDGKEVPEPEGISDYYKTPWSVLYWVGNPRTRWGAHGWMPPAMITANKPGKLLPSPGKSVPAYLRALELDASSNGKKVSAIVGQKIIIRLKGAPVPGHMWGPAKLEGDAIEQVGQMKFIPDARPRPRPVFVPDARHQQPGPVPAPGARPQPMPGGLVAHTMGGPGKYVFTFRAVKAGKAEVTTIKGRFPRARRPVRTFALTVNVKPDPTAERVRKLKANLDKFAMTICYRGQGPRGGRPPRWCRHITLSVPPALVPRTPSWQVRQISKEQAEKIIDRLAKTGFLARAAPRTPARKMGDRYALAVYMRKSGPRSPMLMDIMENIGWGPQLLKRLESLGLKEVLDGDAAKAVDFLLEPLERFRKEKPAPAKVEKIDTKKSGTYTSGNWKYQYTIRAVGTRSERRFSGLTYDGNLIAGAKMWDRIKTPWGMMQYYQMSYVRGWMLELTGGTPINPKKGRLLPSPEKTASSRLAPLELDESSNGKTVSATVGQEIIISLKSNPTTGYSWLVGKIEGDALGQVGKVKYEQRKHPSGMVGVGGKEVFTFRAAKVGTAKLTLEYKRGWEKGKPPAKTFTLNVTIKADPAAERAEKLKAGLDKNDFELVLRYRVPKPPPGRPPYLSLGLVWSRQKVRALGKGGGGKRPALADIRAVAAAGKPNPNVMRMGHITYVRITKKQDIIRIIDHLATDGVLAQAVSIGKGSIAPAPFAPCYEMQISSEGTGRLRLNLGWGQGMLKRLDGLRKVLDGDAAKEMDKLLKHLEGKRKEWEKKPA